MNNNKVTFEQPNGYTLQAIDTYMQSSKYENTWEKYYSVMDMFNGEGSGKGWEGVEKCRPSSFLKAWNAALLFMVNHKVLQEDIIKNPFGL